MDPFRSNELPLEPQAQAHLTDEQQLAALTRERASREEHRAAARKAQVVAAKLAATKRGIAEDEIWAELEAKHGVGAIVRINTPHGMVVVQAGPMVAHKRFQDEIQRAESSNPKIRRGLTFHDACEHFAGLCLVYPSKDEFDALCHKVGTLVAVAANTAFEIGKAEAKEDEGE